MVEDASTQLPTDRLSLCDGEVLCALEKTCSSEADHHPHAKPTPMAKEAGLPIRLSWDVGENLGEALLRVFLIGCMTPD